MIGKAKKKKSKLRIFLIFILMVGFIVFVYNSIITIVYQQTFKKEYEGKNMSSSLKITNHSSDAGATSTPSLDIELDPSISILPDKLKSSNVILVRLKDHTILMQKNSEEKIYPASLTKMMTAIVAIENLPNLKEKIKLTNSAFQGLYRAEASMAGFQPGEQVRAIDLLYGILLPSGAECCVGLADKIAGSEREFVKMMNQKASDLGMIGTHFENVTGLQNDNHYTTVKDLAILLSYALENDTFRKVFTASRHSTQPTNKHPGGITFYSTMFEKLNNKKVTDGEILGGKTGYTKEAGLCLGSFAKVGRLEYILISAGARGDHYSEQYNIIDALAVYNSIGKQ